MTGRRIGPWIIAVAIVASGGYFAYTHQPFLSDAIALLPSPSAPCASPLTYSIGSIDPRFGITKATLETDLKEAAAIWNQASGKDLLQYAPSGGTVTVSLVYDSRQAATVKLQAEGIQISTSQTTYNTLKAKYDALDAKIASEQSSYDVQATAFERDQAAYNAAVDSWNTRGGAPRSVYDQLQQQKAALANEYAALTAARDALNADISTLNALATVINQLIVQLNLNVAQYNQAGAAQGEFEEGVYEDQDGVRTITIYEFANHTELVRVLAHEMGHALGLGHVADPTAIMYKVNQGTNLAATPADLAELDAVCKLSP